MLRSCALIMMVSLLAASPTQAHSAKLLQTHPRVLVQGVRVDGPPIAQRWVWRSKMPTPQIRVKVLIDECPFDSNAAGCTDYQVVWVAPGMPASVFYHELGHILLLGAPAWLTERFKILDNEPSDMAWYGDWLKPSGSERAAEAYASCSTYGQRWPRFAIDGAYGYQPTPGAYEAECALLRGFTMNS